MQKIYILLCLFFSFSSFALAKEPVTKYSIKEIQRLGLEVNGLVLAARSQVNIAEAGVVSASAYPNPEVTVMAGPDAPRLPFELTGPATMQRTVTVSQPIENPFFRQARIGSAEANVEVNRASLDQVRADLAAQLRIRVYELLLRKEQAAMETAIFDVMEEIQRRIKLSVEVGELARFELIRADTEVMTAASRKEAALLSAERARVALFQLTAGALPPDFAIQNSLSEPVELPVLEELYQQVLAANPEILRLEAEQNRTQLRIEQERASVLPSMNILYSNFQDRQFTSNTAGLSVTVPLFYRRRGEINSAIFDSARVRETLEYRRYEINRLLESAWQAMQIAKRRVEMYEGGIIRTAENALRVAEAAFRLGERGFIEVLDTQRILRTARLELLQAYFELQSAAAEIDRLRAHYPKE
ncbi:TolC family protein [Nitrosomonas sp. Nm33]|uniref:TolC family protein n=1 Tax=Nitrosomonas sp. Nm33 TaxID=133724 RepID=UPI0008942E8B|nr:TolC family protein [Nitrosomonas sp. Nm33]SDY72119.1 outer membrane protein, cobalt-zinc-cadmium efflux system [Nitrosomonas sp. Nm33]